MPEMIAMRDAFGQALVELAEVDDRILVLDADLATSTKTSIFQAAHPPKFLQIGIAEQNLMGIAAGLATMGFVPFPTTFACFASKRALDQVRIVIAQPKLNVKVVGSYSGLLCGKVGKTHQSVQDIAIMRSMPNMVVLVPGDGVEAAKAVWAAAQYDGPVYLRLTRDPSPVVFSQDYDFRIGQAVPLREGRDVTILTTGLMVYRALEAADALAVEGIDAHVVHVPTIKPLDEEAIIAAAARTGLVVTAEEHSILGGLGGAVAEVLSEKSPTLVKRVGIKDMFGDTGTNEALLEKYCLGAKHIAQACRELILKRKSAP